MAKPICTKENPAPEGEKLVPGWRSFHANPDFEHPSTITKGPSPDVFSEGYDDHLIRTVYCMCCEGLVRQYMAVSP